MVSPIDGEEDIFKAIKELVKEKAKIKINEGMKYIKIEVNRIFELKEILTPTIRYFLKN